VKISPLFEVKYSEKHQLSLAGIDSIEGRGKGAVGLADAKVAE
jgi:hypothetical protein